MAAQPCSLAPQGNRRKNNLQLTGASLIEQVGPAGPDFFQIPPPADIAFHIAALSADIIVEWGHTAKKPAYRDGIAAIGSAFKRQIGPGINITGTTLRAFSLFH